MIHIALYQPEIPPNTGNIIRLCANGGFQLHLIYPLGFDLSDARCQRAGLDYHEYAKILHHADLPAFRNFIQTKLPNARLFAASTHGQKYHSEINYLPNDIFLFGPETRGLPADIRNDQTLISEIIKIPMQPNSRSLNLSNSVAILAYEAWRQLGYK